MMKEDADGVDATNSQIEYIRSQATIAEVNKQESYRQRRKIRGELWGGKVNEQGGLERIQHPSPSPKRKGEAKWEEEGERHGVQTRLS